MATDTSKRTRSYREDLLADLADYSEAIMYLNAAAADSEETFLRALRDVCEACGITTNGNGPTQPH